MTDIVQCYCGATPDLLEVMSGRWRVFCPNCGSRGLSFSDMEDAIKSWNPTPITTSEIDSASSNPFSHQTEPGYEPLAEMMQKALDQAQYGKGKERHANDRPFLKQSLMNHTRAVGTGYPCGQAMKKAEELHGMVQRGDYKNAIEECKGAAVYLLATALYIEEFENHERVYKKGEVEQIEVKEERALVNFHCFCCGFDITPGTIIYSDRPDDYICPNCRNYVSGMTRES